MAKKSLSMRAASPRLSAVVFLAVELVILVLFAVFTRYDEAVLPDAANHTRVSQLQLQADPIDQYYGMFQDVHVMIFVGFGFLMVFLKRYTFSSVGLVLLLGAILLQWAILVMGFYRLGDTGGRIYVSVTSILNADIAVATVLISMGAVLGRTTPLQLVVMGLIEMVCFAGNEYLGGHVFKAIDLGGSMFVHVFGAYFGLAVSRALGRPANSKNEGSSYTSDTMAMIGTLFLWLFWPSFNGALASGHSRHRAVVNTYLALASCCVAAFSVSSITQRESKFNMVHIQNATLAGGVAMGTAADLMVQPVGALVIGFLAGILSVVGFAYLQPFLLKHLKIHDTCGVHNLHGMPGVLGGIVAAIVTAIASEKDYGKYLYKQFPAMTPSGGESLVDLRDYLGPQLQAGEGRSAGLQAAYQICALVVTLGISGVTGTLTGIILKQGKLLRQLASDDLFDDAAHWEVPDDIAVHSNPVETRKLSATSLETAPGDPRALGAPGAIPTVCSKVDVTGDR